VVKTSGGVYAVAAETDGAGAPEAETAGATKEPAGGEGAMRAGCIRAEPDVEDPTIQAVEEADGAKASGEIATSVAGEEDAKSYCE
jgi:hypothetical protein